MLGSDAQDKVALHQSLACGGYRNVAIPEPDRLRPGLQAAAKRQEIHRWRTDEVRDEERNRPVIDVARTRNLLDHAVVHHGNQVRHRHGLQLIMRDVNGGRAKPVMQRAQFLDHRLAHFGIERSERLVHQEALRLADDRPPKRDALTVAAGEGRNGPIEEVGDTQDPSGLHHAPVALRGSDALAFEGKADIAPDIHMRIERK